MCRVYSVHVYGMGKLWEPGLSEDFAIPMVRPAILCSKATTKAALQAQDRLQQAKGNQDCKMTINVCQKIH